MTTHLMVDMGEGPIDFGPARPPHDSISGVRRILSGSPAIQRVRWQDPDTGYIAFEGVRSGASSFGWRSSSMGGLAFAGLGAVAP